eukprot:1720761-Rhodomonas_salina.1
MTVASPEGEGTPGTGLAYAAMRYPRMLLCAVRYWPSVCCCAMSGTVCDVRYQASVCSYVVSVTELAYAAALCHAASGSVAKGGRVSLPGNVPSRPYTLCPMPYALCPSPAISGTDIAYGPICTELSYGAMRCRTDMAYGPTCLRDVRYRASVCCYTLPCSVSELMCGTELAYAATRCAVRSLRILLRIPYAMCGTELAHACVPQALCGNGFPLDSAPLPPYAPALSLYCIMLCGVR